MSHLAALNRLLCDTPLAYNPSLARAFGSVKATIFWLAIARWVGKSVAGDYVYKSADQIEEETGLSRREQEYARKHLIAAGLLDERRAGRNGVLHFRPNLERALAMYVSWIQRNVETGFDETSKPDSTKRRNPLHQDSYYKNPTEDISSPPLDDATADPSAGVVPVKREAEEAALIETVRSLYNESARRAGWRMCFKVEGARRRYLLARLKEQPDINLWREAFVRCEMSRFLAGAVPDKNGNTYTANLDLFTRAGQLDMILHEGKFQDRRVPIISQGCNAEPPPSEEDARATTRTTIMAYIKHLEELPPLPDHFAPSEEMPELPDICDTIEVCREVLRTLDIGAAEPGPAATRVFSAHDELLYALVQRCDPGWLALQNTATKPQTVIALSLGLCAPWSM